jgi:sugar phosphate isomerase/epimerase
MTKPSIGLQLYSVHGQCKQDLPGALKRIREIGYRAVEPWGFNGTVLEWMNLPVRDLRKLLDDNGLSVCGFHVATSSLQGDNLARTIEFNQLLGNRFLIIAWDGKRMTSEAGIAELAGILIAADKKLEPLGLYTGYHAHDFDFKLVDGRIAWDSLFSRLPPRIIMQLDVGNCAAGGGDPVATLRKFPGRARSIHVKEYGGAPGAVVGEGAANWPEIFKLCEETQNTEWYVVEEEFGGKGMDFEPARRSLEKLRGMGK